MHSRRWLTVGAWCLFICQLTVGGLAPLASAHAERAGAPPAAMTDEDCCAGSHPGQACPMHRRQPASADRSGNTCRLTCAEPDAYASWLTTVVGWVPDSTRCVYHESPGAPAAAPVSSPLFDLAPAPQSPPPRG